MKRKICIITTTRADYGILSSFIKKVYNDKDLKLQLIVSGSHLSNEFGQTYKIIEQDFKIDKKLYLNLKDDSKLGILNSMSEAINLFGKAFEQLNPDIIVVLGDRYEIFCAVSSALVYRIPVAHIHGGELTFGAYDDAFRHSITKMSHIHFTATKEYKNRVIQLGEQPNRVFNVGALGVENIKKLKLLSKEEFKKSINFKLNKNNIIVTFHPVTLENQTAKKQFGELLKAINTLKDTNIIFTKANSDTNGKIINKLIEQYVSQNNHKAIVFASLGQIRYLSALKYVDMVVGNSSSGIIEAPSFKVATINIGSRQDGRIKANNIIDCLPNKKDILKAFDKAKSKKFLKRLSKTKNLFKKKDTASQIKDTLKNINLKDIIKKSFYDISCDKIIL